MVVISAGAGGAAFTQASKEQVWIGLLAGALSLVVAALSAINTFLNPNEKESAHLTAAHAYDKLNNEARLFWSIESWQSNEEVLTSRLKEMIDRKDKLNSDSPQIPRWAYLEAKKGIAEGEADFRVDQNAPTAGAINKPD
jgi:hypothetical protein